MSEPANVRPIIIKRKKVISGGGHHGGAWKVAYADFVTAMMAFFMLMWLLNATTEQQRKGLADYFSPTIPINRVSGGGNGAFGGESIFSEMTLPKNGTGASSKHPTEENQAKGNTGNDPDGASTAEQDEVFESLDAMLLGHGGESAVMENALKHIITRVTDEGLIIEIFALAGAPLFVSETDMPTPLLSDIAMVIADVSKTVINSVAVGGHVRTRPVILINNPVWELSAQRASRMRVLLEEKGINKSRMQRVTGHADREPVLSNTMAERNNRLEIVLLRDDI
ncbi:chemotaxis protein MotB [Sulfitobacter sp. SK012]|uniref:flagellar motor protein MotB n=1 Tax=Sulfitobacter sp. SK012 TaxID=1389005 RepID=UPI000E0B0482|nr:flagellar motor protein MotB [Sulfitobacter sp. SK012]AXI44796.1 chemotaxis protein MotB [Sulfitobacter sp. SK012]